MKLSVEAKVAACVAAGFIALTVGAIGQEQHRRGQTGGLSQYGPINNTVVNANLGAQEHNGSLIAHNTEPDQGE